MNGHLPRYALLAFFFFSFTFLQAQKFQLSAELKRLSNPVKDDDPMRRHMQISGDKVLVEISMKGDVQATRAELGKMGFKELGTYGVLISGFIPVSSLPQLEGARTIVFARPAFRPVRSEGAGGVRPGQGVRSGQGIGSGQTVRAGQPVAAGGGGVPIPWPVISQGDTAIGSYLARQKYKVDGTGVKIGVISDSWFLNINGPADSPWQHDELPGTGNPNGHTTNIQDIGDIDFDGMDEGRAMMEVMHDVAPGATFAFTSGMYTQTVVASDIIKLADAGCHLIGDDYLFVSNEPFFQDGIISKAISQVRARGIPYFTIAGDYGLRSYESEFRSSTYAPLGDSVGTAHNFSAAGTAPRYLQPVSIPKNGVITVFLQWDQNSYAVNGIKSVTTDLDVYLLDKNMQSVGYPSKQDNIATGEPNDNLGFRNETDDTTFYVVIVKRAGPDPVHIKYIMLDDAKFIQPTDNPIPGLFAPSMFGHANSENAITVGSAYYFHTPAYGVSPAVVDSLSAKEGTMIYLDTLGNRITPVLRHKPDVIGPDAVNTSSFDPTPVFYRNRTGDIAEDADDRPNFFGTASALSHVMGTAALMIQRQKDGSLKPDKIKSILTSTASDMDDPYTPGFDNGFDYATGYGFIDADKAVGMVTPPPPADTTIQDLTVKPLCTADAAHARRWQIVNPNAAPVDVVWYLIGTDQYGKVHVPAGDTSFMTEAPYFKNILFPSLMAVYWKNSYGWRRIDLTWGSSAVCGTDEVSAVNSDERIATELLKMLAAYLQNNPGSGSGTGMGPGMGPGAAGLAEVYGNPSTGVFRLYYSLDPNQHTTIGLYSAQGRPLQAKVVEQGAGYVDVDATGYQPGIYLLKVQNGGFTKTIKLIRN